MSEKSLAGTLDSKIKDVSEHIKNSVLDPARKEKEDILASAKAEASRIIADAQAQAEKIVKEAGSTADKTRLTAESMMRIAARQAVDTLKIALEKQVLSGAIAGRAKEAVNDAGAVRDFIRELITLNSGGRTSAAMSIKLSAELKEKLMNLLESDIAKLAGSGIKISDETMPEGFKLVFRDSMISFDFTTESVTELLSQHLRPEFRKYLFEGAK